MVSTNELKKSAGRHDDLTIEELKACPGNEDLTDEQASHIINSLKELSILLYYYAARKHQKIYSIDNQPTIRKLEHKKAA